jgi:hypothetical protein
LNALIKEERNPIARDYYKRAVGSLNDTIQNAAQKNPEFGESWNRAEELFKSINAPSAIRKIIEDNTDLEKILHSPLAKILTLGSFGYGAKALKAIPVALAARTALRAYELYSRSPHARKILSDIGKYALDDNKKALAFSLRKLEKEVEEFDEDRAR